ncbi:Mitochondrial import inner membrane translocase subunit Tim9 [Mizuhopecten yessoensis]|uniref:Mitochondrial import inner membrane translocase subunit n=1 Tax=Mizuhopecten yessoensis TaxID=6573 RepID=A0A210QAN7_MIZYE|nr:Mitochondrial import inner membrane translocase subunit Tim9 [Mizuhopecten yessoensis]
MEEEVHALITFVFSQFTASDYTKVTQYEIQVACLKLMIRASFQVFNYLSEQCFTKCVIRLDNDTLTNREKTCVEKCYEKNMSYLTNFKKFWTTNNDEHAARETPQDDGR